MPRHARSPENVPPLVLLRPAGAPAGRHALPDTDTAPIDTPRDDAEDPETQRRPWRSAGAGLALGALGIALVGAVVPGALPARAAEAATPRPAVTLASDPAVLPSRVRSADPIADVWDRAV